MQNGRLHNIPSKTKNYIFTAQASSLYSSSPIAEKINKRQKSLSSGSPPPRNPYPDKGSSSLVHADLPHHSFTNNLPTTIKRSNVCRWGEGHTNRQFYYHQRVEWRGKLRVETEKGGEYKSTI